MQQYPPWELHSCWSDKNFSVFTSNLRFRIHTHKWQLKDSILSHLNSIQRAILCLFNIWCEIIRSSETNTANIAWICKLCSVGLRTYQHPCSRPISIRPYSVSSCDKTILFPDLTSSLYQSHHRRKKPLVKNEWCRPTLKMYVGEEHNLS
jgi:hypothetical protein